VAQAWEAARFQCATEIEHKGARVEAVGPMPWVLAHDSTLGQILANLLSNALKFVPEGLSPHIRFRAEDRGDNIRLWVEDNGIGIEPQHHQRIFRPFERLGSGRYPGTGIGLAIVRTGTARMGGNSGLDSRPGKGSRFWIELPKAKGA
jgi:signal transduction histidine kinase